MKVTRTPDALVITRSHYGLATASGLFVLLGTGRAGFLLWPPSPQLSQAIFQGLLPAGLGVAAVLAFARIGRFEFATAKRQVRWSQRSLLGRREGRLSFDAVRGVRVQTMGATPAKRRLVLMTDQGNVPIGDVFEAGQCEDYDRLAQEIEQMVNAQ